MSNDDDFSALVGDVTRLKHSGRKYSSQTSVKDPANLALRRASATAIAKQAAALGDEGLALIGSEEKLEYYRSGLDRATRRRLQQGHFSPAHNIDLHGYSIENARDKVWQALQIARQHHVRCILIVHGKAGSGYRDEQGNLQNIGTAPIKSHVNHWLRQVNDVMAFCSAQPRDGGTGAIYVLLKKPVKESD
ncbi:MAG: Smr/MutS family protein [Gammaproteobacteria bacterium]|jgi:DNA-nicking Smr family endonuclease|nr:Smr/MutS family protein [Gammaproteobacteria bacterium]